MRIDGYDEARCGSSHHCPKSRWDTRDGRPFHQYYPGQFQWLSMPRLNFSIDEAQAEPNYMSNHRDYNCNPESPINPNSNLEIQLKCNQGTMAIDNRYDVEVVDGATNFKRGRYTGLYDQVLPTSRTPPRGSQPRHSPESSPRSRPRFYSSPLSGGQPWSRPDGHWSGLRTTMSESMPHTDDYRLRDILCSTARKLGRA